MTAATRPFAIVSWHDRCSGTCDIACGTMEARARGHDGSPSRRSERTGGGESDREPRLDRSAGQIPGVAVPGSNRLTRDREAMNGARQSSGSCRIVHRRAHLTNPSLVFTPPESSQLCLYALHLFFQSPWLLRIDHRVNRPHVSADVGAARVRRLLGAPASPHARRPSRIRARHRYLVEGRRMPSHVTSTGPEAFNGSRLRFSPRAGRSSSRPRAWR